MPYQFLTGLFGMNFAANDDSLQDPMLSWEYGYWVVFWGGGGLLTTLSVLWMHKKGILKNRSTSWSAVRTAGKPQLPQTLLF